MSTLESVLQTDNMLLLTGIQDNALVLRLEVDASSQTKKKYIYESRLKLYAFNALEKLPDNFDSFQDLIEYIKKDPVKHVDIDLSAKRINIVAKVGNKKASAIELGSIPIELIQTREEVLEERDLQAVINYCKNCTKINWTDMQKSLLILTNNIKYLLEQQNVNKQQRTKMYEKIESLQYNPYSQTQTKQEQVKPPKPKQIEINDQQRQKIDILISEMQAKINKMEFEKINKNEFFDSMQIYRQVSESFEKKTKESLASLNNTIMDAMSKLKLFEVSLSEKSNRKDIQMLTIQNAKIQQKCLKEISKFSTKVIEKQIALAGKQNEQKLITMLTTEIEKKVSSKLFELEKKIRAEKLQPVQPPVADPLLKKQISAIQKRVTVLQESKQKQMAMKKQSKVQERELIPSIAQQWVDSSCYFYASLQFQDDTIIATRETHIFGNKKIIDKYQFTVELKAIKYDTVIGIIDMKYKELCSFSYGCLPRSITYGSRGYSWNDKTKGDHDGFLYKVGEKLTVVIDKQQKSVEWKVGNKMRHRTKSDSLSNSNIVWVPYIFLSEKGDTIAICQ